MSVKADEMSERISGVLSEKKVEELPVQKFVLKPIDEKEALHVLSSVPGWGITYDEIIRSFPLKTRHRVNNTEDKVKMQEISDNLPPTISRSIDLDEIHTPEEFIKYWGAYAREDEKRQVKSWFEEEVLNAPTEASTEIGEGPKGLRVGGTDRFKRKIPKSLRPRMEEPIPEGASVVSVYDFVSQIGMEDNTDKALELLRMSGVRFRQDEETGVPCVIVTPDNLEKLKEPLEQALKESNVVISRPKELENLPRVADIKLIGVTQGLDHIPIYGYSPTSGKADVLKAYVWSETDYQVEHRLVNVAMMDEDIDVGYVIENLPLTDAESFALSKYNEMILKSGAKTNFVYSVRTQEGDEEGAVEILKGEKVQKHGLEPIAYVDGLVFVKSPLPKDLHEAIRELKKDRANRAVIGANYTPVSEEQLRKMRERQIIKTSVLQNNDVALVTGGPLKDTIVKIIGKRGSMLETQRIMIPSDQVITYATDFRNVSKMSGKKPKSEKDFEKDENVRIRVSVANKRNRIGQVLGFTSSGDILMKISLPDVPKYETIEQDGGVQLDIRREYLAKLDLTSLEKGNLEIEHEREVSGITWVDNKKIPKEVGMV